MLAKATWNQLGSSIRDADFSPMETTLTENNLFEIAKRHPEMVKLKKFSGNEESQSGADWLWWIGGRSRGMLFQIQAKKLSIGPPNDGIYNELQGHRGLSQLNQLLIDSKKRGAYPLYCFYNSMVPWRYTYAQGKTACGLWPGGIPDPYKLTGCLITTPWHVLGIRNSGPVGFENSQSVGVPWDCLVCCTGGQGGLLGLADQALAATRRLTEGMANQNVDSPIDFFEPEILDQPPEEIQALIGGGDLDNFRDSLERVSYLVAILDDGD